jgi:hypothetical protein
LLLEAGVEVVEAVEKALDYFRLMLSAHCIRYD